MDTAFTLDEDDVLVLRDGFRVETGQGVGEVDRSSRVDEGPGSVAPSEAMPVSGVEGAPYGLEDIDNAANVVASRPAGGGRVGLTARAHDADGDGRIAYTFTDSASGRFAIDRSSGVVTVADRNQLLPSTAYAVTVRASDGALFADKAFMITTAADYLASAGPDVALNLPDHLQEGVWFDVTAIFQNVEQLNATVSIAYSPGGSATNGQDFILNEGSRQVSVHQTPPHDYPVLIDHAAVPDDGMIEDTETAVFTLTAPGHTFSNGASTITLTLALYDAGVIAGTAANDVLNGTAGSDRIGAGPGNDQVHGGDGGDVIQGESGDDALYGDGGADRIYGQAGNDILIGGAAGDYLEGGAGADTYKETAVSESTLSAPDIIGGFERGVDVLDLSGVAGPYVDVLFGDNGYKDVYYAVSGGTATGRVLLSGEISAGDIVGDPGTVFILDGGSLADTPIGGAFGDVIRAGGGDDYIIGRGGADNLTGGAGADTFAYELVSDSTTSAPDTITDFQHGIDKINLYPAGNAVNIVHDGRGNSFIYYSYVNGTAQGSINVVGDVEASDLVLQPGVSVVTTNAFAGPEPDPNASWTHIGHGSATGAHVYLY